MGATSTECHVHARFITIGDFERGYSIATRLTHKKKNDLYQLALQLKQDG